MGWSKPRVEVIMEDLHRPSLLEADYSVGSGMVIESLNDDWSHSQKKNLYHEGKFERELDAGNRTPYREFYADIHFMEFTVFRAPRPVSSTYAGETRCGTRVGPTLAVGLCTEGMGSPKPRVEFIMEDLHRLSEPEAGCSAGRRGPEWLRIQRSKKGKFEWASWTRGIEPRAASFNPATVLAMEAHGVPHTTPGSHIMLFGTQVGPTSAVGLCMPGGDGVAKTPRKGKFEWELDAGDRILCCEFQAATVMAMAARGAPYTAPGPLMYTTKQKGQIREGVGRGESNPVSRVLRRHSLHGIHGVPYTTPGSQYLRLGKSSVDLEAKYSQTRITVFRTPRPVPSTYAVESKVWISKRNMQLVDSPDLRKEKELKYCAGNLAVHVRCTRCSGMVVGYPKIQHDGTSTDGWFNTAGTRESAASFVELKNGLAPRGGFRVEVELKRVTDINWVTNAVHALAQDGHGRSDDTRDDDNGRGGSKTSPTTRTTIYKGKALRSWPQLPAEVVRSHLPVRPRACWLLVSDVPTLPPRPPAVDPSLRRFRRRGQGASWPDGDDVGVGVNNMVTICPPVHHTRCASRDGVLRIALSLPVLIATFHLLLVAPTLPLPATWEIPDLDPRLHAGNRYVPWHENRIYVAARDMREMEGLMTVCPQWGLAVEHHQFWHTALTLFDPLGSYAYLGWPPLQQHSNSNSHSHSHSSHNNSSSKAQRLSPYLHLRTLLAHACLPCRINAPLSSHGLGNASPRRATSTLRLGAIPLCKDHYERRRGRWCGVCLLDGELGRAVRGDNVKRAREDLDRAEALVRWVQGGGALPGSSTTTPAAGSAGPAYESRNAAAEALARAQHFEAEGMRAIGAGAGLGPMLGLGVEPSGGITRNEDESIFPGVHVTCRSCRSEWLWRYAILSAEVTSDPGSVGRGVPVAIRALKDTGEDTETGKEEVMRSLGASGALPGVFEPQDRTVRGAVSAWVELGEGTVARVLQVAGERGWLRRHTRWGELMGQAVAAKRWSGEASVAADRGRVAGAGAGAGGAGDDKPDYTGHAQVVFVTREEREQRRARARSASPDSVDGFSRRRGRNDTAAFANNATNVAAYASAGYTTTNTTEYEDYDEEYEDYDDDDDSLDDFDEEDEEELASALELNVKEMALGDWARAKILDGAWLAPADVYYNNRVPGGCFFSMCLTLALTVFLADHPDIDVPAVHPVAWAISRPSSPPASHSTASAAMDTSETLLVAAPTDQRHPGAHGPSPPTYQLAEAAHHAHMRQMRTLLLPAFRNVVRRIIVECALDAAEAAAALQMGGEAALLGVRRPLDPAMRAARMSLADVVKQVREEEGIWFDGMDWSAKRRNAREQEERERDEDQHRERRHRTEGSDDSSAGTPRTSDTSPVLSTSTLGTTPSPPPLGEHRKDKADEEDRRQKLAAAAMAVERQPTIAVMPVLESPRLLRPIPYIPETIAHLPQYSLEALRIVWREACAPLYHCRCSVCERAMVAAQAAQGGNPAKAAPTTPGPTAKEKDTHTHAHKEHGGKDGPWVMHIPAEDETDGRGADSVVSLVEDDGLTAQQRYWKQMEEQEGPGAYEREMELIDDMRTGKWETYGDGVRSSSDGEDYEDEDGLDEGGLAPAWASIEEVEMPHADKGRKRSVDELEESGDRDRERGGTPPKRARTVQPTVRLVKRRSEELDVDARDAETASTGSAPKRARVERADSPPDSTSTPGTASETSAYEAELRYPTAR
ncbi:hypothetical protein C8F04DRAFT_1232882 [Mycena alexandri]|uniref:Uncharacterized protein n=1 Tax=Mycena alexandri TaxID=1745969 RepID=A0AAD6X543_9AGAR|nr:hypothetical protein C8F04DRAFT_1232882 [Mycena alexandri]